MNIQEIQEPRSLSIEEQFKETRPVRWEYVPDASASKGVRYRPVVLQIKSVSDNAVHPTKATLRACGWDLYASAPIIVAPHSRTLVPTGLIIKPPEGHYIHIFPRSGLAIRGIDVGAGIVDPDYRGEVGVLLINTTDESFFVDVGHRVAQFVVQSFWQSNDVIFGDDASLPIDMDTDRGEKGFGSSGV